jgi:hypothetical protein
VGAVSTANDGLGCIPGKSSRLISLDVLFRSNRAPLAWASCVAALHTTLENHSRDTPLPTAGGTPIKGFVVRVCFLPEINRRERQRGTKSPGAILDAHSAPAGPATGRRWSTHEGNEFPEARTVRQGCRSEIKRDDIPGMHPLFAFAAKAAPETNRLSQERGSSHAKAASALRAAPAQKCFQGQ